MSTEEKTASRREIPQFVFLIAAVLLACAGAFFFREEAGIVRCYPLLPVFMTAAAFLPLPWWQRGLLFLVPVFALAMIETRETGQTVLFCALAVVLFVLSELGARLIKKSGKRLLRVVCGVLLICLCFALYAAVCGNPFSAHAAKKTLTEYVERTYDADGGLTFSDVRYDVFRRRYVLQANSRSYPTETACVAVNGPMTEDRFLPLLEDQCMRAPAGEIALAIRAVYAEDVYTVYRVTIAGFDSDLPLRDASETEYASRVSYCVEIYGKPLYPQMAEKALGYANAIFASGKPLDRLEFVSAQTFRTRFRASAVPSDYTPAGYGSVRPGVYASRNGDLLGILQTFGLEEFLREAASGVHRTA